MTSWNVSNQNLKIEQNELLLKFNKIFNSSYNIFTFAYDRDDFDPINPQATICCILVSHPELHLKLMRAGGPLPLCHYLPGFPSP